MNQPKTRVRSVLALGFVGLVITIVFAALTLELLRDVSPPLRHGAAFVLIGLPNRNSFANAASTRVHVTAFPSASRKDDPKYAVTACGSGSVRLALVLEDDARLIGFRPFSHGVTTRRLGPSQVAIENITLSPCISTSDSAWAGTGFAVTGTWRSRFYRSANGEGAFSFPHVGNTGTHMADQFMGLRGWWASPLRLTVTIKGGPLGANDRLDLAKPDTAEGSTSLTWSGRDYLAPVARWTNMRTERRNQQLLIVYSILIGVGASLLGVTVQQTLELTVERRWRLPGKVRHWIFSRVAKRGR